MVGRSLDQETVMATSHFCSGTWREGPVADCPKHTQLAKTQANVYRGVGDPGGRSSTPPKSDSGGSSGSAGSSSGGSSPAD